MAPQTHATLEGLTTDAIEAMPPSTWEALLPRLARHLRTTTAALRQAGKAGLIGALGLLATSSSTQQAEAPHTAETETPEASAPDHWSEIRAKIKDQTKGRREVMLQGMTNTSLPIQDSMLYDDGGKEIETQCVVTVSNASDIEIVARIAKDNNYGVMALGSLTSAVGIFKVNGQAQLYGLKGYIGVKIAPKGKLEGDPEGKEIAEQSEGDNPPRILTDEEGNQFEIIDALDGQMQVLKSLSTSVSHRVRAWAGLTPASVDAELRRVLGAGHTTGLDLTTAGQAQIGGAVCTGSQGPARQSAKRNIRGMKMINGRGETASLGREEAKKHVGLNGMGGVAAEITLDVIQEPAQEFGLFIPIQGSQEEGLKRKYPMIMAALSKFMQKKEVETDTGMKTIAKYGEILLKGLEIVTLDDLKTGKAHLTGRTAGRANAIIRQMEKDNCQVGLMLNGNVDNMDGLAELFFDKVLDAENADLSDRNCPMAALGRLVRDKTLFLNYEQTSIEVFGAADQDEIGTFKTIRESIPDGARGSKKLGFTSSTDINCRVTANSATGRLRAYQNVWKVYWKYIDTMRRAGFRVYVYGHALSGNINPNEESGGIDPHVRVSWEFRDGRADSETAQQLAIEKYMYMEDQKNILYTELMELDGADGIIIEPGEKGAVTNGAYMRFLEDNFPEKAEEIWQTLSESGGRLMGSRCGIKLHSHPPRLKDGLLNYFAEDPDVPTDKPLLERLRKSIILWCENSHRGAEGKKVLSETLRLIREWLDLGLTERVFYTESPAKAVNASLLNLVDVGSGKKGLDLRGKNIASANLRDVQAVVIDDPKLLDNNRIRNKKKILCINNGDTVDAEMRKKADVVIYSAEALGTGGEMGIIITNTDTIRHAEEIESAGNNIGYMNSFVEMNNKPHESIETPRMQVIAELGCLMAERTGGIRNADLDNTARLQQQSAHKTLGPGPSQLNRDLIGPMSRVGNEAPDLADIETKLRAILGVPQEYKIFFGGSATQAMEQITQSLDLDNAICLSKGAFGDRQEKIARRFKRKNRGQRGNAIVKRIPIRWGEGENTTRRAIKGDIEGQLQPHLRRHKRNPREAVLTTGHETSTGVQADTTALFQEVDKQVLRVVDGTSEIGRVKRDFVDQQGNPIIDVYFGSFQKFFGLPAGLSVMIVSPRAMEAAKEAEKNRSAAENKLCYRTFPQMEREQEEGIAHYPRGINQLGIVLDSMTDKDIDVIREETRQKMEILRELIDGNEHIEHVVEKEADRSEVMVHFAGIDVNITRVRQKLRELGIDVGEGYGPLKKTTIRLYASPNIDVEEMRNIAGIINRVINESILPPEADKPTWLHDDLSREWNELRSAA